METISPLTPAFPDIVFVNPAAGGGRAPDSLPLLQAFAARSAWNVEFRITHSVHDLIAQAKLAAASGYLRFLVLGGDGSFHDLVNALSSFPDAILGILPAGGGNDLADSLGLPRHPVLSAELLQPANRHVDVSRIDLQTQTHTLGLLSSNQRRPRTEEWIVDSLSTPGVIQDRSAHELDRLLRPMSGGGLVPIATKRI